MVLWPEEHPRGTIDKLLSQAGWVVCDLDKASIHASAGVAAREFPLKSSQGLPRICTVQRCTRRQRGRMTQVGVCASQ